MRFEESEADLRVVDKARNRKGTVHSVSGSRTGRGRTRARVVKIKWENGTYEDFHDGFPEGIELIPW